MTLCALFAAPALLLAGAGCGNGGGGGGEADGGGRRPDASSNDDGGMPPVSACAVSVNARGPTTCVVDDQSRVLCWGRNHRGQLGDGTTSDSSVPKLVDLPGDAVQVETGISHTCARLDDGRVFCWGFGGDGELGDGSREDSSEPVRVSGIDDAEALFVGGFHACALRPGEELWCWGDNDHGQIGDGRSGNKNDRTRPVQVATSVQSAALGEDHSCVLDDSNNVSCWGSNERGQLGDGQEADRSQAAPVVADGGQLGGVDMVDAGAFHTCAVTSGGAIWCWGRNDAGQLGSGEAGPDQRTPVQVVGISSPDQLVAGQLHTCVLKDGQISCFGANGVGQLGTGDEAPRLKPTPVIELDPASDLGAGDLHTCAVVDGDVYCWGYNANGQLGAPAGGSSDRPIRALGC